MLKAIIRSPFTIGAGVLPFNFDNPDKVSQNSKTAQNYLQHLDKETGWDRLYLMFSTNEYGSVSAELNSIYQATFLGLLTGAIYGGFLRSRVAYVDFMENNEATAFKSHFDAKKKLQDKVTLSFAKGAWRWGWRLGLFTGSYVGIVTAMSVYRGKSSINEYLTAGAVVGSSFKINMGLRGMAVGGLLGGALGGIAGLFTLLLLKASGTSMEEIRYWQYKWRSDRDVAVRQALVMPRTDDEQDLSEDHDRLIGKKNIALETLEDDAKTETQPTKS